MSVALPGLQLRVQRRSEGGDTQGSRLSRRRAGGADRQRARLEPAAGRDRPGPRRRARLPGGLSRVHAQGGVVSRRSPRRATPARPAEALLPPGTLERTLAGQALDRFPAARPRIRRCAHVVLNASRRDLSRAAKRSVHGNPLVGVGANAFSPGSRRQVRQPGKPRCGDITVACAADSPADATGSA